MYLVSLTYLENLFRNAVSVPTGLSSLEMYLVFGALLAIGLAMMFRGTEAWKAVFTAAGLYLGGYFTYNLVIYLNFTSVPIYIAVAIGAIIGAVILTFVVRLGLSVGFGYLVYLIATDLLHIQFYYALGIAVIGFGVAYILYKDFVHVVSGIVGAFAAYYAMTKLGLPAIPAQAVAAVLYVIGVAIQEWERRKKKRLEKKVKEQGKELKEAGVK